MRSECDYSLITWRLGAHGYAVYATSIAELLVGPTATIDEKPHGRTASRHHCTWLDQIVREELVA